MHIEADTVRCAEEVRISADQKSLPEIRWQVSVVRSCNHEYHEHDAQREQTACESESCLPESFSVVFFVDSCHDCRQCSSANLFRVD